MTKKSNALVMNKIESLDISRYDKDVLIELFRSELELGNSDDRAVKKRKVKRCRDAVIKGASNEDL